MGFLEGPWKSVRVGYWESPWKSVKVLRKSVERTQALLTACRVIPFARARTANPRGHTRYLVRRFLGNPVAVASLAAIVSRPLFGYFCQLTDRVVCEPVRWSFQVFKFVLNFFFNLMLRICHSTIQ